MRFFRLLCPLLLLVALGACAPQSAYHTVSAEEAAKEKKVQLRLAAERVERQTNWIDRINYNLAVNNVPICKDKVRWGMGATLLPIFLQESPYEKGFREIYGKTNYPVVIQVMPGSPAEKAGLQLRDEIVAVGDGEMWPGWMTQGDLNRLFDNNMDGTNPEGVVLRVKRDGKELPLTVHPVRMCSPRAVLVDDAVVNACADGKSIMVNKGMLTSMVRTDEELSLIMGHEMAHAAMLHSENRQLGASIGTFFDAFVTGYTGKTSTAGRNLGAQLYSHEQEFEADYVGMYICARAGVDVDSAVEVWHRLAADYPSSITVKSGSHPNTPERFVALEKTAAEIDRKRSEGQELLPNMKADAEK